MPHTDTLTQASPAPSTATATQAASLEHGTHRCGWDRLGIWASVACGIHCLLAPVVLLTAPAWSTWWEHPLAHWLLAVLVLPLAGLALVFGHRQHQRHRVLVCGTLGGLLIVAGLLAEPSDAHAQEATDQEAANHMTHDLGTHTQEGVTQHAHHHDQPHTAQNAAHADSCCPAVTVESGRITSIHMPLASGLTCLGSVFLVAGHALNLRHQKRCVHAPRHAAAPIESSQPRPC